MTEMHNPPHGPLIPSSARADLVIRRGITEVFGVFWEEHVSGSGEYTPKELPDKRAVLTLKSLDGNVWLTKDCHLDSAAGLIIAQIDVEDTNGLRWKARKSGHWSIKLGETRIADGIFTLEV